MVTTKPPSQVSGTEILASNNRAMLGRNVQTTNIRGVSSTNPYSRECSRLCNNGNFNIALSSIADAVKSQTFPKEIKHVMIGHGSGRAETEWITAGRGKPINILEYINSNKDIKAVDMVLVTCCVTGGILNPLRPGKGLPVDLSRFEVILILKLNVKIQCTFRMQQKRPFRVLVGWGGRIRTSGMAGPKPAALPLGDAPLHLYYI